jgi:putative ABC transport system permease protein
VAIILVDPARFDPVRGFGRFQYIEGLGNDQIGFETLQRGGALLAANTILERFGVGPGDQVQLRSDEGFEAFEVGAVVVDYTGGGETFIGSIADLPRFGGGSPDLYVMTVLPETSPAEARERLREAFPELLLDITLNENYRQQVEELISRSFTTTNALLVLAAIIAAIGVANTLGMNLARRAHEIAVLRALGLRRSGVAGLVMTEGLVVLSIGAVLGAGFGLLLADVITAGAEALTGFRLTPVTPWTLLVWALLFIPTIGMLASYLPARRAGRLSPRIAIDASEVS